jgi:UDP-N-acetyl-D-glucosamine dehydrogenase
VIGLGYVGLPLALLLNEKGHTVFGVDTNPLIIDSIQKHTYPSYITKEEQPEYEKHTIQARTDTKQVRDADVVIICVPTPVHHDYTPDLQPLISAAKSIAPLLQPGTLVIIESTVSPGVCENIVLPILEKKNKLIREKTLFFAHCPERINPGDLVWTLRNIPRVVGGIGPLSLKKAVAFYAGTLDAPVRAMHSLKEAEAVKMVENSFRDVNIAFVNELAMSFQTLGIDIIDVIKGASTKPFSFMAHYPGIGVGGHCIPVDPYYLIEEAARNGFNHQFLKKARKVNNGMPHYTVSLLKKTLSKQGIQLKSATVTLLGLAYKNDIADTRESPALTILQLLKDAGATVQTFDPYVPQLSTTSSLDSALQNSSAVLLATNHSLFTKLEPADLHRHNIRVILDGKNCLDKNQFTNAGIVYVGIGH